MGMEDEMIRGGNNTETGSLLLVVVHRYYYVICVMCMCYVMLCHCMHVVHVLVNMRSMCINTPPCCTLSVIMSESVIDVK